MIAYLAKEYIDKWSVQTISISHNFVVIPACAEIHDSRVFNLRKINDHRRSRWGLAGYEQSLDDRTPAAHLWIPACAGTTANNLASGFHKLGKAKTLITTGT